MLGERRYPDKFGRLRLPPGGYGQDARGRWWCRAPGGDTVLVPSALVTEHPDGSITVGAPPLAFNGCRLQIINGRWRTS